MTETSDYHTDSNDHIIKIGSKGEIFPPKEIRERLGFAPDQVVVVTTIGNKMIVRKITSPLETLKEPPKGKITYQALKKFRQSLNNAIQNE